MQCPCGTPPPTRLPNPSRHHKPATCKAVLGESRAGNLQAFREPYVAPVPEALEAPPPGRGQRAP